MLCSLDALSVMIACTDLTLLLGYFPHPKLYTFHIHWVWSAWKMWLWSGTLLFGLSGLPSIWNRVAHLLTYPGRPWALISWWSCLFIRTSPGLLAVSPRLCLWHAFGIADHFNYCWWFCCFSLVKRNWPQCEVCWSCVCLKVTCVVGGLARLGTFFCSRRLLGLIDRVACACAAFRAGPVCALWSVQIDPHCNRHVSSTDIDFYHIPCIDQKVKTLHRRENSANRTLSKRVCFVTVTNVILWPNFRI